MTNRTPSSETPDVLRPATETSVQAARQPFVVKPTPAFVPENPALQVAQNQKIPSATPPKPSGNLDNPLATPLDRLETIANAAEGQMITPIQPGVPAFAPGEPPQPANVQRMEMPTQTSIPSIQQVLQGFGQRQAQAQGPTLQQLQSATYPTQTTPRYVPPVRFDPVIQNAQRVMQEGDNRPNADPDQEMRLNILRNLPLINNRGILSPDDLGDRSVGQVGLPPANPPQSLGQSLGGIAGSMQGQRDRFRNYPDEDRFGNRGTMNRVTQNRTNQNWGDWITGMIGRALSGVQQSYNQLGSEGAQSLLNPVQAIPAALREAQALITGQPSEQLQQTREAQARAFEEFLPPQVAAPVGTQTIYPWDSRQQPTRSLADYTRGGSNFGDYGTGAVGAALFLSNLAQAAVMTPLYTVTDNLWRLGAFVSGQPQPTHLNLPDAQVGPVTVPGWLRSWVGERRARQFFLEGVDPSVTNQRDTDRYLGILSYDPETPQWIQALQFGTGLAIDTLMLGSLDNVVLAGPRTAIRESRQALTNAGILPRLPELPNNGTVIMNRVPQMPVPQQGGLIARTNEVHQQYYAPGVAPNYTISQPIQIPAIPAPTAQTLPTIPPIQTGGLAGSLSVSRAANLRSFSGAPTGAGRRVGVNMPQPSRESLLVVSPSELEQTANSIRDLQRRRIERQNRPAPAPELDANGNPISPEDAQLNRLADSQQDPPLIDEMTDGVVLEALPGGARDFYDLFTEETRLEGIANRTPEQETRLQEIKGQLNSIAESEAQNSAIIDRFRNLEQQVQRAQYRPGGADAELLRQYDEARNAFVNLNRGDRSGNVVPFTRSDGRAVLRPVNENPQSPLYFRPRLANENDLPAPSPVRGSEYSYGTDNVNENLVQLRPLQLPDNVIDMTYGRNRRDISVGANTTSNVVFNVFTDVLNYIDELFAENADLLARADGADIQLPSQDVSLSDLFAEAETIAARSENVPRLDRSRRMYNDNVRSYTEGNGVARVELTDGTVEEVPIELSDSLFMRHTQPRIEWDRQGVARAAEILDDPNASDLYYNDGIRTLDDGLPNDPSLFGLDEDGVVRQTQPTPTPQQTVAAAVLRGDIVQTPSGSIITRQALERVANDADITVNSAQIEAAKDALSAMPTKNTQAAVDAQNFSPAAIRNIEANDTWFKLQNQIEENSLQTLLASKGLTEADIAPGLFENFRRTQQEYINANNVFFRAKLNKGTTLDVLTNVRERLHQVQDEAGMATYRLEDAIDKTPARQADEARVAQLQENGLKLRQQLEQADQVVKASGWEVATEEVNAFDRISPVIKPQSLAPAITPAQIDDVANRLDPTQPLPQTIRRSNAELTRLAQSMMDENGRPLVSPKRKTPLRSSDIDKLNQRFPGMFDRYGEPIPAELSHPMARVDLGNGETALMTKPDPDAEGTVKLTEIEQVAKATNEVAPPELKAETPEQMSMRMAKEGLEIEYAAQAAEVSRLEVEVNTLQSRVAIVQNRYEELLPYTRGDLNSSLATREMNGMDVLNPEQFNPLTQQQVERFVVPRDPWDDLTRGMREKMWYHGSSFEFNPDELPFVRTDLGGAVDNELGLGLYVTDNPKLAEMFARASATPTQPIITNFPKSESGFMYQMRFEGRRVLDADVQAPDLVRKGFKDIAKEVFADNPQVYQHYSRALGRGVKSNEGMPLKQYWMQMRESYGDVMNRPVSEGQMQEFVRLTTQFLVDRAGVSGAKYALKDGSTVMAIYSRDLHFERPNSVPADTRMLDVRNVRRQSLEPVPDPVLNGRNARLQTEGFLHENIDTNVTRARLAEADLAHKQELLSRARQNYERELMTGLETSKQLDEIERRMVESIDRHNINKLNNNADAAVNNAPSTLRKFDGPTDSPCV